MRIEGKRKRFGGVERVAEETEREPRELSEIEMCVLETVYELKNKRRMSTVLFYDVLRRGQAKCKGIRESNLGSILNGLIEDGYLGWVMPGYDLTVKGKAALNVW